MKMTVEEKKCITPKFRVSFPYVFDAHSGFENQEPKFSVVMLFAKNTDLKELKRAAFNAAKEKWGEKTEWPKNLRLPFKDGNEKSDLQGYKDTIVVSASSKQRPGIVNQQVGTITKEDNSFYAGCYARATLVAFAYDKAGNKGVSFSLQNLQKLEDGAPFNGRKRAEDEFEAVDDGSESASSYTASDDDLEGMGI